MMNCNQGSLDMIRRPTGEKRRRRTIIAAAVAAAIFASEIPTQPVAAMPLAKLGGATTADLVDHAYWRHHHHWHWWFPPFWFRPPWAWHWGWRYHRHHHHHHAPAARGRRLPTNRSSPRPLRRQNRASRRDRAISNGPDQSTRSPNPERQAG